MLQPRVVNRRASAPKTRNGCLTCKTRRVKCDETKPICRPCAQLQRECLWKRQPPSRSSRTLIPITPQSSTSNSPNLLFPLTPTQTLHFQDPRDAQYFRTYQEQVLGELAAALPDSPWGESVLRACHTAPFILQTVVALGALNKSIKMAFLARQGPQAMKPITMRAANSHRAHALSSYGKAIAGMRVVSLGPASPTALRHLLIAGLLVHCMEAFLGSSKQAFQHSQSGYKLLLNWISSNPSLAHSHKGLLSPNTSVVEDQIFQEYTRLDADNAILSICSPSATLKDFFHPSNSKTLSDMPTVFSSLPEAQSYEELLLQQTSHLISIIHSTIRTSHAHINHPQTRDFPGHIIDPINLPSITHLLPTRNHYLHLLQNWLRAYSPILALHSRSSNTYLSVGSAILQTRILDTIITLTSLFPPPSPTVTTNSTHLGTYQQILYLIQQSLKQIPHVSSDRLVMFPGFQSYTTFHHPLNNMLSHCRDAAIRHQTLAILLNMAPRDGDMSRRRWVFRIFYQVALEEANRLSDGTIPPTSNYEIVFHETSRDEKSGELKYTIVCGRRAGWRDQETGLATWKFRFKTFGEDEWRDLVVGKVCGDDDEKGIEGERKRELKKWPKGVKMPSGLAWELIGWEIRNRVRTVGMEGDNAD